jgi:hypothetical protein
MPCFEGEGQFAFYGDKAYELEEAGQYFMAAIAGSPVANVCLPARPARHARCYAHRWRTLLARPNPQS